MYEVTGQAIDVLIILTILIVLALCLFGLLMWANKDR